MAGERQKLVSLLQKKAHNGRLVPGQGNPPGNCLVGHITSQSTGKWCSGGLKMAILKVKKKPLGENSTDGSKQSWNGHAITKHPPCI